MFDQIVVSLRFDDAIQSIVQAVIILSGVTVSQLVRNLRQRGRAVAPTDPALRPAAPALDCPIVVELRVSHEPFGQTIALGGVDLSVAPRAFYAVIGENGAGKPT